VNKVSDIIFSRSCSHS